MEATFKGGQGPEGAVVPWMVGWMDNAFYLKKKADFETLCVCVCLM